MNDLCIGYSYECVLFTVNVLGRKIFIIVVYWMYVNVIVIYICVCVPPHDMRGRGHVRKQQTTKIDTKTKTEPVAQMSGNKGGNKERRR